MTDNYKNLRVLILGLGLYPQGSGAASARFFARAGARVTVTDRKTRWELGGAVSRLRGLRIRFVLGRHLMEDPRRSDLVVRNPGVRADSPELRLARRLGIPVVSDISVFFRLCPAPIVGVTGTRGKSTTTALLAEMLKGTGRRVFVGGNIQVSPLTFAGRVRKQDIVVLELSSWMLETLRGERRSPQVAVLTNVMRDHLNTYRGMKEYAAAKASIFEFQDRDDVAVLNRDNALARGIGRSVAAQRFWFSKKSFPGENGAFVRDGWIIVRDGGAERRVARTMVVALAGEHNLENALAAIAAAAALGVPAAHIKKTLRSFRGLHSRQEIIRRKGGIIWVNDTTATTPDATIAALRRFGAQGVLDYAPLRSNNILRASEPKARELRRIILIAGGADKKLDFAELAREVKRRAWHVFLLPGNATDMLLKELARARSTVCAHRVASMREAVRAARAVARRGDIVILSPGAASFGLFQNEFDRGEQFVREVRRLR